MTWHTGDSYEGQFVDGLMHGQGIYRCANGSHYQGQFCENLRQGFGIFTYEDGSLYQGTWEKDNPEDGKVIYPSGEVNTTNFVEANADKKGTGTHGLPELPKLPQLPSI